MTDAGSDDPLLRPLSIGSLRIAGRLFKSATSETRGTPDGYVTDQLIEFYEPIAQAGTPLIISGNLYVSPMGKSTELQTAIDDDDQLPGLRRWVDSIHHHGVAFVAQLNHGGRQIKRVAPGPDYAVAPSAVLDPSLGVMPRELRVDELPEIVESFAGAAARAKEAGFDGIQIHAAHGYLLSSFLTPHTNRRTDGHGGSLVNRMRLLLDVLDAIRASVGDDFPVLAKLNGTDLLPGRDACDEGDLVAVGVALQEHGLDALEISRAHYESPGVSMLGDRLEHVCDASDGWPITGGEGYNLPQAEHFTAALTIPVICVGGFLSGDVRRAAIDAGRCDAVSAARGFIADPFLFRHVQHPDPAAPVCGNCNICIARLGVEQIDCYSPEIGRFRSRMLSKARFQDH
jgi:2,4-dienoyl-CoA reductase-like NADH-dependent reductase (Old Yellow Enzyme family)